MTGSDAVQAQDRVARRHPYARGGLRGALSRAGVLAAVIALSLLGLACGSNQFSSHPGPDRDLPAGRGVYWGVSIGSQLTGIAAPGDPSAITAFTREVGRAPAIIDTGWQVANCVTSGCGPSPFPQSAAATINAAGAIPLFSLETVVSGDSAYQSAFSPAEIASGRWDDLLEGYAREVRQWGHPIFLRFDWEMNTHVWPWDPGNPGATAADYVAAWRHLHDIFARAGVTNVTWVWCPNVATGGDVQDLASYYPGSRYVDWTGLDGYNFGGTSSNSFLDFNAVFEASYKQIVAFAPDKPMMIAEFGTTDQGGSKAAWLTNALATVPAEYPQIRALLYYDANSTEQNWSLESSPQAVAAFTAGIAAPVYVSAGQFTTGATKIAPPRLTGHA